MDSSQSSSWTIISWRSLVPWPSQWRPRAACGTAERPPAHHGPHHALKDPLPLRSAFCMQRQSSAIDKRDSGGRAAIRNSLVQYISDANQSSIDQTDADGHRDADEQRGVGRQKQSDRRRWYRYLFYSSSVYPTPAVRASATATASHGFQSSNQNGFRLCSSYTPNVSLTQFSWA